MDGSSLAERAAAIAAQARSYADAKGATKPAEEEVETAAKRLHWHVWEPARTLRVVCDVPMTVDQLRERFPAMTNAFPWYSA